MVPEKASESLKEPATSEKQQYTHTHTHQLFCEEAGQYSQIEGNTFLISRRRILFTALTGKVLQVHNNISEYNGVLKKQPASLFLRIKIT
jgi:hypothetical protein